MFRGDPIAGGRREDGVGLLQRGRTVGARLAQGRLEQLGAGSDDLDAGVAGVGLVLTDVELLDLVLDPEPHQLVHDARQHQRVDDMTPQLDDPRVALVVRSIHNPAESS